MALSALSDGCDSPIDVRESRGHRLAARIWAKKNPPAPDARRERKGERAKGALQDQILEETALAQVFVVQSRKTFGAHLAGGAREGPRVVPVGGVLIGTLGGFGHL